MDLLGEIVEHETEAPKEPVKIELTGFPELGKLQKKKESRWKFKKANQPSSSNHYHSDEIRNSTEANNNVSEAESINQENLAKIAKMSESEILEERDEIMNSLNPKLVESLLKKISQRENPEGPTKHHTHAEGYSGWIGGTRNGDSVDFLPKLDEAIVKKVLDGKTSNSLKQDLIEEPKDTEGAKKVRYDESVTIIPESSREETWEEVEDLKDLSITDGMDAVIPSQEAYESEPNVHFSKPAYSEDEQELDLDDPSFYEKLHEKYYPDLPKETSKLSWMTKPVPTSIKSSYESISDMRFDFNGDLVKLDKEKILKTPTYAGLHHHSEDPHLPGYTLRELSHLGRSTVPGQRSISIRTLGRILHKLGLQKYNILPLAEDDSQDFNMNIKGLQSKFEDMMWDLIDELRIIETIEDASDPKVSKNISVQSYAIEALWLWKQGGGRKIRSEEELIAEIAP